MTRLFPEVPHLLAEHLRPLGNRDRMNVFDQLVRQAGTGRALEILADTVPLLNTEPATRRTP